ncbi:ankyrin repeat domain-containing protein [Stappia sp. MMSF_3263]|uniref:ankyrin repeat domain-containing protein n=1 Tax=Stappia sp. MMSF_3263 TaxID=3046693 RepID=UPI00273F545F|nr:ankyrin repeat domain-containing protein [Stappia sp. MMSF_3263]
MPDVNSNPNHALETARRSAKALKRSVRAGDADALSRIDAVFDTRPDPVRHSHCLHAIAREAGSRSWPAHKTALELAALDRDQAAARLGLALYAGRDRISEQLLLRESELVADSFHLALALADEERVGDWLDRHPDAASVPGRTGTASSFELDPLVRVAGSTILRHRPERAAAQRRIVERLLSLGADPDARHSGPEFPDASLSVLYATLCVADNLEIARLLLEAGADPNDNECAYHSAEAPTLEPLALLIAHGVRFERTNALLRMLDFDKLDGARMMLQAGADPNEAPGHGSDGPSAYGNALHHAILRGRDGRLADLLLDAGADGSVLHFGRSAYALAAVNGNGPMMEALERRGLASELSPRDRFLAALARGDAKGARNVASAYPAAEGELTEGDRQRLVDFARMPGRIEAIRAMLDAGIDPQTTDREGLTPLHAACWFGRIEYLPLLLERGGDLEHTNMYGGTALGTAVHGSANCPTRGEGDYAACVALLLAAGARIRPEHGDLVSGSAEVTELLEDWLEERAD